jgi:hypothetical protein
VVELAGAGCDPHAIKSALYYATQFLRLADEARRGYELDTIRAEMLTQAGQMKEKLRQLTSIETLGECFAERILLVRGRKKSEIRFVQSFPALLLRLENILNDLKLPPAKRDTFEDWLISNGEALFYLYVKEVTRKAFPEEAAVLLEAAADAYGIRMRAYTTEAVSRRYRRFRGRKDSDYQEMQSLVRAVKANRFTFLEDFLDMLMVQLYFRSPLRRRRDPLWVLNKLVAIGRKHKRYGSLA